MNDSAGATVDAREHTASDSDSDGIGLSLAANVSAINTVPPAATRLMSQEQLNSALMLSASDETDTSDDAANADASCAEQECQSCAPTACNTSVPSAAKSSSPPRGNATNLKSIETLNAALMLSASDDDDDVPAHDAGNTRPSLPQHCQPCAHTAFATSSSAASEASFAPPCSASRAARFGPAPSRLGKVTGVRDMRGKHDHNTAEKRRSHEQ
eukprot:6196408-Pleurochrysis_carterae.AAC.2